MAAISRGGKDADDLKLKDMAAQLLAMLSVGVDGDRGGRKAWDELQGKLAQVTTYAAKPKIKKDALLQLLEDAMGLDFLRRAPPEAKALLGKIMKFLKEETSRATGTPIPRLRELLQVVADQLDMLPLRDSEPVHMVDEDSKFCEHNVDIIVKSSPHLSARNAPYAVVSIVGAQSSGKSYLLNRLFGTKFPEMDAAAGWSQTTRGIMISRCIGPSMLVLDVEGFDGKEKGQDTLFEKQAALFALTISDVMLVNMNVFDMNREQAGGTLLFKTIFKERRKLDPGLTNIVVVLRQYNGETPLKLLRDKLMQSLEQMWRSVNTESQIFEEYIEVNVFGLPDKSSENFPEEVTKLRHVLSQTSLDNNNRSGKVPASSFSASSNMFWDKIKKNRKLDIPSHQEALARLFCRQIVDNAARFVESHKDYKLLKAEESPDGFKVISDKLMESVKTMYDDETEMYDAKVRDIERQNVVQKVNKVFMEDSRDLIRKIRKDTSNEFKAECGKQLKKLDEINGELKYDDRMVDLCVDKFMTSCGVLKEFDSDYLHRTCGDLQKDMQSYIHIETKNLNDMRWKKEREQEQRMSDKKLEERLNEIETVLKKQHAAAEIKHTEHERQLKEQLAYTQNLLTKTMDKFPPQKKKKSFFKRNPCKQM